MHQLCGAHQLDVQSKISAAVDADIDPGIADPDVPLWLDTVLGQRLQVIVQMLGLYS